MLLRRETVALVALPALLFPLGQARAGTALPILPDGSFEEWQGVEPAARDGAGDGRTEGVDLRRLFLANDSEALYLWLEVGRETILQNPIGEPIGNHLRLYLDLDDSVATGFPVDGLGIELELRFGERQAMVYDPAGVGTALTAGQSGYEAYPTHSSEAFEIRVPFTAAGSTEIADRLRGGGALRLLAREAASGGDRLPDAGEVTYETSTGAVEEPTPIRLGKRGSRRIRLLSFNVERTTIAALPGLYRRILQAVRPDLIAFQEILGWSAGRTRRFVARALPLGDGRRWQALQVADTVTVSSHPIVAAAAVDGNLVALLDLPDERTPHDLVLFNAHTPCCGNEEGRDREHDNLAALWRDLLDGVGPFRIRPRDAVIFAGDLNLVGFRRQLEVLRDGTFIDPANGPDFAPGRREGSLKEAVLRHSHTRTVHTWRRTSSAFTPGRLDYVLFSGDVARLKTGYVLDTATLPDAELAATGLREDDSLRASDHLALVADFVFRRK